MRETLKKFRILIAVALFLTAIPIALLVYVKAKYPPEVVQREIVAQVKKRFGYELELSAVDYTLTGTIELRKLCLRYVELSPRCIFTAEKIYLRLEMLPLIRGVVQISQLDFHRFEIYLFEISSKASDRKPSLKSWEFPQLEKAASPAAAGTSRRELHIKSILLDEGKIFNEAPSLSFLPKEHTISGRINPGESNWDGQVHFTSSEGCRAKVSVSTNAALQPAVFQRLMQKKEPGAEFNFKSTIESETCPLNSLDPRLGKFSGITRLDIGNNQLNFAVEKGSLQIQYKYPLDVQLSLTGVFDFKIQLLSQTQATITHRAFSLNLTDIELSRKAKFSLQADLAQTAALVNFRERVHGTLFMNGQLSFPLSIYAAFRCQNCQASASGMQLDFPSLAGELRNQAITLSKQALKLNQQSGLISLAISNIFSHPSISGSADFEKMTMPRESSASQQASAQSSAPSADSTVRKSYPFNLSLLLRVQSFQLSEQIALAQLSTQIKLSGQTVELSPFSGSIFGGSISGSLSKSADQLKLKASLNQLKLAEVSNFLKFQAQAHGTLNGRAQLETSGKNIEEYKSKLSGELRADVGRGKIKNSFFQKGILSGPLYKIEEKLIDVEFKELQIELGFVPGKIALRKVFFDAEEWQVKLRAESDWNYQGKSALDIHFNTTFIENIANPAMLGIADRLDGSVYHLPFGCRGNVLSGSCYQKNW